MVDLEGRATPQRAGAVRPHRVPRKVLTATLIGTVVEWYDFTVYGFIAGIIAINFFPTGDETVALIEAYASFAVAYAVRPFAGLLLGRVADVVGRRTALALTIVAMGLSTFLIGLVPPYAAIGIAAPLVVVVLRLVQGLGASGEWTIGSAYLMEHSPRSRWGRLGSYVTMAYYTAMMLGTGLATVLSALMPEDLFTSLGWRVLFVVAGPLALIGRYIRKRLDESPEMQRAMAAHADQDRVELRTVLATQARPMVAFVLASAQQIVAQFALATYVTAGLISAGLGADKAFMVIFLGYAFSFCVGWASGPICDRVGPTLTWKLSILVLTVAAVPGYLLIDTGRFWPALLGDVLFSLPIAMISAPRTAFLLQIFPTLHRGAASGLSYNLGTLAFGATAPLVATALHDLGGAQNLAFSLYLVALGALSYASLTYCARFVRTD